jgi:hypothetical protein
MSSLASRAALHAARVRSILGDQLYKDPNHPVYNFIFQYFHFKPSILFKYNDMTDTSTIEPNAFQPQQVAAIAHIASLLRATHTRKPHFGCYGLHEYAMLYTTAGSSTTTRSGSETPDDGDSGGTRRPALNRHQHLPLRISLEEIRQLIDQRRPTCTHIDAFRFFTDEAKGKNALVPTRSKQRDMDQPGCVHVTMDLFK